MRGEWLGIDWLCTGGESNRMGIDSTTGLCCETASENERPAHCGIIQYTEL